MGEFSICLHVSFSVAILVYNHERVKMNTATLSHRFEAPVGHALVRFAGSAAIGLALVPGPSAWRRMYAGSHHFWAPGALLLVANVANSAALLLSGTTLCYVVKATIPFWTVLITAARGKRYTLTVYASLLPTVIGVALASASDADFSVLGLAAATISALSQTLMNLQSKGALAASDLTGRDAFCVMMVLNTLVLAPAYLVAATVSPESERVVSAVVSARGGYPVYLVIAAAVAYLVEYALNFEFVRLVSSLTFSITDIVRRLGTIAAGTFISNKTLTLTNQIGVVIALGGVILYSYAIKGVKQSKQD